MENRVNTNSQRMKELSINDKFLENVEDIRNQIRKITRGKSCYFLPTPDNKDFELKIDKSKKQDNSFLDELVKSEVNKIIADFNLPKNFNVSIAVFIVLNTVIAPAVNFEINLVQDKNKTIDFSTKNYAQKYLTEKELELRNKREKMLCSVIYKNKLSRKFSKNLDLDIQVLEENKKTGIRKEEKLDSAYLELIKKSSPKSFEKTKKIPEYKDKIKIKRTRYSNKNIAEKILGDKNKSATIRQKIHRLKEKINM